MDDFEREVAALRKRLDASKHEPHHPETLESVTASLKHITLSIGNGGVVIRSGKSPTGEHLFVIGNGGITIKEGDAIRIIGDGGETIGKPKPYG